jgi:hypothetical protein
MALTPVAEEPVEPFQNGVAGNPESRLATLENTETIPHRERQKQRSTEKLWFPVISVRDRLCELNR